MALLIKNSKNIGLDALISHRFRGFAPRENTLKGLRAALDFGVLLLEFDVRMAKCGTPMIYHDEYANDKHGVRRLLCDIPAYKFKKAGGRFASMPTLEALFSTIKHHKNKQAKFLIDIKDLGFEHEIHALVMYYGLAERVVYVSWIAEVLYRIHALAPNIPLCFSHWSGKISDKNYKQIASKHEIFISKTGDIPRMNEDYILGKRMGWVLEKPLTGELLNILKACNGMICIPTELIKPELSDYYHQHNIQISTFSYTDLAKIKQHSNEFKIDMYFVDNKQVFEDLAQ